jgi:hypothetical protein
MCVLLLNCRGVSTHYGSARIQRSGSPHALGDGGKGRLTAMHNTQTFLFSDTDPGVRCFCGRCSSRSPVPKGRPDHSLQQWRGTGRIQLSVRFEVFTAVMIRFVVFWAVTPCSLAGGYHRPGRGRHLHLQFWRQAGVTAQKTTTQLPSNFVDVVYRTLKIAEVVLTLLPLDGATEHPKYM